MAQLIPAELASSTILAAKHDRRLLARVPQQVLCKIQLTAGIPAGVHDAVGPGQNLCAASGKLQLAEITNRVPEARQVGDRPFVQSVVVGKALRAHEAVHGRSVYASIAGPPDYRVIAHCHR